MRLGKLLLQGLKRKRKAKAGRPARRKAAPRLAVKLRARPLAPHPASAPEPPRPPKRRKARLAALPRVIAMPAPAPTPVDSPARLPAPLAPPVPAPARALTTAALIRPDDPLRKSVEGFLLDQRSPHTRRAYGKDLKRFIEFLHGRRAERGSEPINRMLLIAYKEHLLNDGLEHTTVDRHLATLRSFFRWMVDDGHLEKNPAEGVRFLNPKRVSRTIGFSDEEVGRLLACPDLHTRTGAQHYAILMVLFYCGLRRSELCSLRLSNLGQERGHRVLRLQGKGNAERVIVVTPKVWSALKHYFRIANRGPGGSGSPASKDEYLFQPIRNNRTGVREKPLDPSHIFYIVTKYARQAGIANRVSPHSCRATAISNARDHNVPDRSIQEFAGWASPDMITRYDKRKASVEKSAAHAIDYGAQARVQEAESGLGAEALVGAPIDAVAPAGADPATLSEPVPASETVSKPSIEPSA